MRVVGALPAEVTSFVGRRRELGEIRRLLSVSRLVTLTGIGGVGKTRLATRAAAELRRTFPDGVRFVELAALTDPALLPQTVAAAFGLRDESVEPTDRLAEFLADQQLLLVLDNCEHLADACAVLVGKLLAAAAGLRVLATSRQRLHVEGEHLSPVKPLSVPAEGLDRVQTGSGGFDAVSLFSDRAVAVSPGFSVSSANRSMVEKICRQLDGLPLAIELAAAWLRALSITEIQDRLDDKFTLLAHGNRAAPARQQGLDALLDWSYQLCSPAERTAWARLSVFSGGFDLAAAECVCEGPGIHNGQILELVAGLVDKSVLTREDETFGRSARYRMLATLSEFGADRLAEARESEEVAARHRGYYQRLARDYAEQEFTGEQLASVVRLQREHANIRRALEFSIGHGDTTSAMRLASDLSTFWVAGGRLAEGCRWLDRALAEDDIASVDRARALHSWLILRTWLGVHTSFRSRLREYRALATALDDPELLVRLRVCEGVTTYFVGEPAKACAILDEAAPTFRSAPDHALTAAAWTYLAVLKFITAAPDAEAVGREAVALCEAHGRPSWHTAFALWALGLTVWQRGDIDAAAELQREAIRLRQPMSDHSGIALSVEALAWCAASAREYSRAARLLGAAKRVWRRSGAGRIEPSLLAVSQERCADVARDALGADAFDRAVAEGERLDLDGAIALALGEQKVGLGSSRGDSGSPGPLTKRESEIAALIAEGMSNKQIAARLVISARTAETHVEHILTKLGFTARAQVAAWFVSGKA